jgi:hypothetical protein
LIGEVSPTMNARRAGQHPGDFLVAASKWPEAGKTAGENPLKSSSDARQCFRFF